MKSLHKKQEKARTITVFIMLSQALIGFVLFHLHKQSYWFYSQVMAACYALLAIWLHRYLNKTKELVSFSPLWHQILHWVGLIAIIHTVSLLMANGVFTSNQAGLISLLMLSLATFLSGVHTDPIFLLIGIALIVMTVILTFKSSFTLINLCLSTAITFAIALVTIRMQCKRGEKNDMAAA